MYVNAKYFAKRGTMAKMHHRREGPCIISSVIGDGKAMMDVPDGYNSMKGMTLSVDKLSPNRPSARWGTDKVETEWENYAVPVATLGPFARSVVRGAAWCATRYPTRD